MKKDNLLADYDEGTAPEGYSWGKLIFMTQYQFNAFSQSLLDMNVFA